MKFPKLLQKLRKRAQKTQKDVATQLGISVATVCAAETGNRKPFSVEQLRVLGHYLHLEYYELADLLAAAHPERFVLKLPMRIGSTSTNLMGQVRGRLRCGWKNGVISCFDAIGDVIRNRFGVAKPKTQYDPQTETRALLHLYWLHLTDEDLLAIRDLLER